MLIVFITYILFQNNKINIGTDIGSDMTQFLYISDQKLYLYVKSDSESILVDDAIGDNNKVELIEGSSSDILTIN